MLHVKTLKYSEKIALYLMKCFVIGIGQIPKVLSGVEEQAEKTYKM